MVYLPLIFILFALTIFLAPLPSILLYYPIATKKISLRTFYHLRLFTHMFGSFTPGKLGEYSLLYFLKKNYHIKVMPIFFILSLDKAITIIHILLFSLIAFLTLFDSFHFAFYSAVFLLLVAASFFFSRFIIHKIRWVSVHLFRIKQVHAFLSAIGDFSKSYITSYSPYLLANLASTFLIHLLVAYTAMTTYAAFSVDVPLFSIFLANSVIGLTNFIPLNFFGFGIKEVTGVYLFTFLGVPPAISTSCIIIFILSRYATYLLYFISSNTRLGKNNT